jgi:gliding motility-associated-like protein
MSSLIKKISIFLFFVFVFIIKSNASHVYGGELYYTHLSGLTYNVRLILYGDCGSANIQYLFNAIPEIEIRNGSTLLQAINLAYDANSGTDITPVCPTAITSCNGGTIPGVRQFIYNAQVTLNTTSAIWRFVFAGNYVNGQTGRSGSLTNIASSPISWMNLEATLNNISAANSTATYTTIPTPFFCINKPQNYNQGAVDVDNDILTYSLVPATDGDPNNNPLVSYIPPYTYLNPLAVQFGTFNFNGNTGQMSFTPNAVQRSLVVTRVTETRNGIIVGTSMREMTVVVLNNCNNNPPDAGFSGSNAGVLDSNGNVTLCGNTSNFNFTAYVNDADGDTINVTSSGVPNGATLTIQNNNTINPSFSFTWNVSGGIPVGIYPIYITLQDNGCPFSSKQTLAFTIYVNPPPVVTTSTTNASCIPGSDGSINCTGSNGISPYLFSLNGSSFQSIASFSNLSGGVYTISTKDANGCIGTTLANVVSPPTPSLNNVTSLLPSCTPGCDGGFNVLAITNNPPLQYSIGSNIFQSSSSFTNLCTAVYTVTVKDVTGCTSSVVTNLITEPKPVFSTVNTTFASCLPGCDATATVAAISPTGNTLAYSFNNAPFNTTTNYTNLCINTYSVTVKDSKNCTADTSFIITNPPQAFFTLNDKKNISCNGKNDGLINCTSSASGLSNYVLTPSNITNTTGIFNNLSQAIYTITSTDSKNCSITTTVEIVEPSSLFFTTIDPETTHCEGKKDGGLIVKAGGGTGTFVYTLEPGNLISSSGIFTNLGINQYTVTASDINGCTKSTITNVTAPLSYVNVSSIDKKDIGCFGSGNEGSAQVNITGGTLPYTLAWNTNPVQINYIATGLTYGYYTVNIIDGRGCEMKESVFINPGTCCEEVFIPNAFTPNGDGKNDVFSFVTAAGIDMQRFSVYNRWGTQVWGTLNQKDTWDGSYNNTIGEAGVYFYILKYKCVSNGKNYTMKGDINLIR